MSQKPEAKDRLTGLPDDLLHHIFSLIDSLYIIQASVLCRRFRSLYASTPSLSFSFEIYSDNLFSRNDLVDLNKDFVLLVGNCLRRRDKRLPVSKLVLYGSYLQAEPEKIQALVSIAVDCAVQELHLALGTIHVRLPICLYNTLTLKELKLRSSYISLSNELGFPALTKLHLELLRFSRANFNGEIISRCPNLENLILRDCNIDDKMEIFNITAPKLKKLEISYSYDLWYTHCKFVIMAPELACFRYNGVRAVNCSLAFPCSLDEVEINVFEGKDELHDGGLKIDHKIEKISGLIRMLSVFKSATTIKLSKATDKCLSQASGLGLNY